MASENTMLYRGHGSLQTHIKKLGDSYVSSQYLHTRPSTTLAPLPKPLQQYSDFVLHHTHRRTPGRRQPAHSSQVVAMQSTLSSALVLALSTFSAAAPANEKRSSDYRGDAPAQFSACGASLFMYDNQTPQGGCKIATSTDRSGSGEVVLYDGNCAKNSQNAGTVIINEGHGPSDPPQEFSHSSVGLFDIQTTSDNCGNDGHGCYPRLV